MKIKMKLVLLCILILGIIWGVSQTITAYADWNNSDSSKYVLVTGNVQQPGYYKADTVTTAYELLKKAGLNDSSDFSNIQLVQAVSEDSVIEVGVSETKTKRVERRGFTTPKVEFTVGKVLIKNGLKLGDAEVGHKVTSGEELNTSSDAQMRLLFDNGSDLMMQADSKLRIPKVDIENEPRQTEVSIDEGRVLFRIPLATPGSQIVVQTRTAEIIPGEEGGEFLVTSSGTGTEVHVKSGKILVRPNSGDKPIVLEANRYVSVRPGDRLIESEEKAYEEQAVASAFKKLTDTQTKFVESQKELTFLLCGEPNFFTIISFLPKSKRLILLDIPIETYVGDYMDGILTFGQALTYGGMELARELAQRTIGREVKYTMSIGINDVVGVVDGIGGLVVDIDQTSALFLGLPNGGEQRLDGQKVLRYLAPRLEGRQGSIERQRKVLLSFFTGFKQGNLELTPGIVMDVWKQLHTNVPADEIFKILKSISSGERWSMVTMTMPYDVTKKGPLLLLHPNYASINRIYN